MSLASLVQQLTELPLYAMAMWDPRDGWIETVVCDA